MTDESFRYNYEESLTHGQFSTHLERYGSKINEGIRHQHSRLSSSDLYKNSRITSILLSVKHWFNQIRYVIGYDWIILVTLGVTMALLSSCLDYLIESIDLARLRIYDHAFNFNIVLSYFVWILLPLVLILFAAGFTKIISVNAIGSGIPEMKSILKGVQLVDYLSIPTFVAKIFGLITGLGSGLPIGKEGPFVHLSSIIANWLSNLLSSIRSIYSNEAYSNELLAAACAVGVASNFSAPIGGVLFSIEVTATYFAVRQYWRGFFGAICGAFVFSLLGLAIKSQATITALFTTHFRPDYSFDPVELIAFSLLGVVSGFLGAFFVWLHKSIIHLLRRYKKYLNWLKYNIYIYPAIITLIYFTITFPPGFGKYCAGRLSMRTALEQLFSNSTWHNANQQAYKTEELNTIIDIWQQPNIFITLSIFIITRLLFAAISIGLPIPAGVFLPVFLIGAALGRLSGEGIAVVFPKGFNSNTILPGAYAVVGAAAVTGAVTHTISTSVIVFELTGQITHVLPVLIAVLIANAIAHRIQPSFYDSIILLKNLPYLPELTSEVSGNYTVNEFMRTNVAFITIQSTYAELKILLSSTFSQAYPVLDNHTSRYLIGSVKRSILEDIYHEHIAKYTNIYEGTTSPTHSEDISNFDFPARTEDNGQGDERRGSINDTIMIDRYATVTPDQLDSMPICLSESQIDAAPFQLVEKTSLRKVHTLFALLTLNHSYVTQGGKLVGIVTLKEIRNAIEKGPKHLINFRRSTSQSNIKRFIATFSKRKNPQGDVTITINSGSEDDKLN